MKNDAAAEYGNCYTSWDDRKKADYADKIAARNPDGQPATYHGGRPTGRHLRRNNTSSSAATMGIRALRRSLIYPGNRSNPRRPRRLREIRKPRTGGWN